MTVARSRSRLLGAIGLLTLIGVGTASAGPLPTGPHWPGAGVERVALVCGPFRCVQRPFWRYGSGTGFRPLRRFGFAPARPFGHPPLAFGRFGGYGGFGPGRRW